MVKSSETGFGMYLSVGKELRISSDWGSGVADFGYYGNTTIKSKAYNDFTGFFLKEFTQKINIYGVIFSLTYQ